MHDVIVVGIPLLAILAGILFNRNDVKELRQEFRGEMKEFRGEMKELRAAMKELRAEILGLRGETHTGFARVDADLRQFFHITGKLEGRIDEIAKR